MDDSAAKIEIKIPAHAIREIGCPFNPNHPISPDDYGCMEPGCPGEAVEFWRGKKKPNRTTGEEE